MATAASTRKSEHLRRHLRITTARLVSTTFSERQGKQELPAEAHQLIVAKARQRPAHPDVNEKDDEDLQQKPERSLNTLRSTPGREQRNDSAQSTSPSTGKTTRPRSLM